MCWKTLLLFVTLYSVSIYATEDYVIPSQFASPLGSYPNLLSVDRRSFHPVIHFPRQCWKRVREGKEETIFRCPATDFSSQQRVTSSSKQLASLEEFKMLRKQFESSVLRRFLKSFVRWMHLTFYGTIPTLEHFIHHRIFRCPPKTYIGKYDEDRIGLYTSDLFLVHAETSPLETSSTTDSTDTTTSCQYRTVHVGIDLVGSVGTPVFAFTKGIVHAIGYNPELGDYGNVIVIQHFWNTTNALTNTSSTVYALYGHLDDQSIQNQQVGDPIRSGQRIGAIGTIYENGGWYIPHVHFQLSLRPPETHDMPGAVCLQGRAEALMQYVDPRYVLGPLH